MTITAENIIEAMKIGANSGLGIISLIIVVLSVVGVIFFRNANDRIKLGAYVMLVIGVTVFSYATLQILQQAESPSDANNDSADFERVSEKASELKVGAQMLETTSSIDTSEILETTSSKFDFRKQVDTIESGYIYLGTLSHGQWKNARFEEEYSPLVVGQIVTLNSDRKMFECAPYRKTMLSFKYTFCNDVIGNAFVGQKLKIVKKPEIIGLNRVWVFVEETHE